MFLLLACAGAPDSQRPDPKDSAINSETGDSGETGASGETGDSGETADSGETDDSGETGDSGGDTGAPASAGPCASYLDAVSMGSVDDSALNELSGLAVSRQNPGILWTHEDSGGSPDLYALDFSGATVATIHLEGITNHDWEDIAIGPCDAGWCIVVGEIGTASYDHSVLTVEEPLLGTAPVELTVTPRVQAFTYPGDSEDAEGLALLPDGTPIIVSKRTDATAGIYALTPDATVLEWLSDVPTGASSEDLTARATAADLSTDGTALLLRTYLHLYTVDVTDIAAPADPESLKFALELQGEAVAWDPVQGGFWQVGEGTHPTLYYTGCES
jgi:hypothetical protein